ncbi:hypothetical protein [Nostoc sp.]
MRTEQTPTKLNAKALDAAFAEVTIENLLGWFTHCCYCTSED